MSSRWIVAKTLSIWVVPALAMSVTASLVQGESRQDEKTGARFYTEQVAPILQANCVPCHSGAGASGGLDLTRRATVLKGGHSGAAVVPGKPDDSLLVRAVRRQSDRPMPPQGPLPQPQVETLARWVAMGAPWPANAAPAEKTAPVADAPHSPPAVNAETKRFWSFQPVRRPAVPTVKRTDWVRNPIDAFVLARLEARGMTPAPPAERTALLRRVTYDLTGLPPTPDEVRRFLNDRAPDAYEKVVDRLLASPHYGERWGRHWLDLVRYAETNSFERDGAKPFAWRYRDYVIRSLNADKPYDQFVREQLAGDELATVTPETLIATGYYRLGPWDDEPADPEQARYDELDDIVATTSQTFLGMTVNCARCHDHKIDPIPQRDYYQMLAFFQGVNRYGVRNQESVAAASLRSIAPVAEQRRFAAEDIAYKRRLGRVETEMKAIEQIARADFMPVEIEEFQDEAKRVELMKKRVGGVLSAAQFASYETLTAERERLKKSPPPGLAMALCVTESGPTPPPTHILLRGNPHAPGDAVTPGFLLVLDPPQPKLSAPPPGAQTSGRRRALADWIVAPNNPLTARVLANRLWQFHFGRGIVRSSSNFGRQGTPPTHPELLDWLASEVVARGWHLKPIHRMIVLSSAYRMSSRDNPAFRARDPENDLLWRFDMRRLEAEEVRDSILAVNNALNPKRFGPSIYPTIPAEVLAGQSMPGSGWGKSAPDEQARRSVYIHIKRSLTVPLLARFDAADTDFTCPVRFATTQPTQALTMLNSAFIQEQAQVLADDLQKQKGDDLAAQVRLGLWRVLQRAPTADETARGLTLIASLEREQKMTREDARRAFCVVLLNLNEFLYLD